MRLIDVDRLTDGEGVFSDIVHIDFEKGGAYIMVKDLLSVLDSQPTAYDVDKIMERLKNMKYLMMGNYGVRREVVNFDDLIEIIKGGGLDE